MKKYEAKYLEFYQEEIIKAFEEFDNNFLNFFDSSKPEILKSEDNASIVKICCWVRDYIIHLGGLNKRCNDIFIKWDNQADEFFEKLYLERPYLIFPKDFAQFMPETNDFDNYVSFEDSEAIVLKAIFVFQKYKHTKLKEIELFVNRTTEDLLLIRSNKLLPYHSLLIPKLMGVKQTFEGEQVIFDTIINTISIAQNSSMHTNPKNESLHIIKHNFPNFFNENHYEFGFNLFNKFLLDVRKLRKSKEFNKPDVIYIFWQLRTDGLISSPIGSEQLNAFLQAYNPMMNQKPFDLPIKGNEIRSGRVDRKRSLIWNKLHSENKEQISLISKEGKNE